MLFPVIQYTAVICIADLSVMYLPEAVPPKKNEYELPAVLSVGLSLLRNKPLSIPIAVPSFICLIQGFPDHKEADHR